MINIHHLELFYHVARHGGISAAVRHMPYGVQQPAVSGQILQLEENLGVTLFRRQPFRLTPEGEQLLAFIAPFFGNVERVGEQLRRNFAPRLRIGAAEPVLRHHLPAVLERMRATHPGLQLVLRSGFQAELEQWLETGEVDLAVVPLARRRPGRCSALPLVRLPLVLLVPARSRVRSAEALWTQRRREDPLIGLPRAEAASELFLAGLRKRGVAWDISTEASSLELITDYVARGQGYGVSVAVPEIVRHPRVRALPLEGFDEIVLGVAWRGDPTPLLRLALQHIRAYVQDTWPDAAIAAELPPLRRRGGG